MSENQKLAARADAALRLSALASALMRDASALLRVARCLADAEQPIARSTQRLRRYLARTPAGAAEVAAVLDAVEVDDPGAERRGRMREGAQLRRAETAAYWEAQDAGRVVSLDLYRHDH